MAQKIGIIEDEIILLEALTIQLKQEGFEIVSEIDGNKAVELLVNEKPDLILLDLVLPGTNGFEILEQIKQIDEIKDVPVIVLSNLSAPTDLRRCFELGAEDFFIKASTDIANLIMKIKGYFSGKPFPERKTLEKRVFEEREKEKQDGGEVENGESLEENDDTPLQQPQQRKRNRFILGDKE